MSLEAIVLQQQDLFGYGFSDIYATDPCAHGFTALEDTLFCNQTPNTSTMSIFNSNNSNLRNGSKYWDTSSCSQDNFTVRECCRSPAEVPAPTTKVRRKRQRNRSVKNQEDVEHQRITHIAVERNRRKQMNDYLHELRSMMPTFYVQRGDQSSIVGGAINFVKQLEQHLQSLEAHKRIKKSSTETEFSSSPSSSSSSSCSSLFSDFFSFPQYSTRSTNTDDDHDHDHDLSIAKKQSTIKAEVEVTMVESHANVKVLIRRQPKQLLKMVDGLCSLYLSILHINVTATIHHMVLYSFSVKAEEECRLTSVKEMAAAVHEMVGRIQNDAASDLSCDS